MRLVRKKFGVVVAIDSNSNSLKVISPADTDSFDETRDYKAVVEAELQSLLRDPRVPESFKSILIQQYPELFTF